MVAATLAPGNTPATPQERAAVAAWMLCLGVPVTANQMASKLGMSRRGARKLLGKLARVLPIYQDEDSAWHLAEHRPEGL